MPDKKLIMALEVPPLEDLTDEELQQLAAVIADAVAEELRAQDEAPTEDES